MKIALLTQFAPGTADWILTEDRRKTLEGIGHEVTFIQHEFRGKNPLFLLLVSFWRCWRILFTDMVFLQKALPLTTFYAGWLRLLGYHGRIVGICDDWEGVGGFVTIRSGSSWCKKMIVTGCEELFPRLCHEVWCVSKILADRFSHDAKVRDKIFLAPNGSKKDVLQGREPNRCLLVGYVGTFNNLATVEFLSSLSEELKGYVDLAYIGAGEYWSQLRQQCGKHVIMPGKVARATLYSEYPLDVGLVYLNDNGIEGTIDQSRSSTKLFEYLAHGIIPVCSNVGEPKRLLTNWENGILIDNNPQKWASQIRWIQACKSANILRTKCLELAQLTSHERILSNIINKKGV